MRKWVLERSTLTHQTSLLSMVMCAKREREYPKIDLAYYYYYFWREKEKSSLKIFFINKKKYLFETFHFSFFFTNLKPILKKMVKKVSLRRFQERVWHSIIENRWIIERIVVVVSIIIICFISKLSLCFWGLFSVFVKSFLIFSAFQKKNSIFVVLFSFF